MKDEGGGLGTPGGEASKGLSQRRKGAKRKEMEGSGVLEEDVSYATLFSEGWLYAGAVLIALMALVHGDALDKSEFGTMSEEEFARFLQPETKVEKYPALVAEWSKNNLSAHFPRAIPAEARKVRLSAHPGYLQGGGWFQVRFVLPAARVKAIYDDATARAKAFYDGGDQFTLVDALDGKLEGVEGALAGTSFYTDDADEKLFPDDYRIFVFYARDGMPGGGFRWNHGESTGVVVSLKRNEVIYYLEDW
jgi:hypothetical protein